MILAPFQVRSLGILLAGARRTITAAVTFTTAGGGFPNDLSSVRLAYKIEKCTHTHKNTSAEKAHVYTTDVSVFDI